MFTGLDSKGVYRLTFSLLLFPLFVFAASPDLNPAEIQERVREGAIEDLLQYVKSGSSLDEKQNRYRAVLQTVVSHPPPKPQAEGDAGDAQAQALRRWITSLETWRVLGIELGYRTPYHSPLGKAGLTVTEKAIGIVNVGHDDTQFLTAFFVWSSDYSRYEVAVRQPEWIRRDLNQPGLLIWHDRLAKTISYLKKRGARDEVVDQFGQVDAEVVALLLEQLDTLDSKTIDFVLGRCRSLQSIQVALDLFDRQALTTLDLKRTSDLVKWTLQLAENQKQIERVRNALGSFPGRVLIAALVRAMKLDGAPDPSTAEKIVDTLDARQQEELHDLLPFIFRERKIDNSQIPFLDSLRVALNAKWDPRLGQTPKDFQLWSERILLRRLQLDMGIEGLYKLKFKDGDTPGILTLAFGIDGSLIAGLDDQTKGYTGGAESFFDSYASAKKGILDFRRFYADGNRGLSGNVNNPHLHLELSKENERVIVKGYVNRGDARDSWKDFEGFQEIPLRQFEAPSDGIKLPIGEDAVYSNPSWDLHLFETEAAIWGHLAFRNGVATLPFSIGDRNRKTRVIRLETGEQEKSGKYVQIRAQMSADKKILDGIYLESGRSIRPFRLKLMGQHGSHPNERN